MTLPEGDAVNAHVRQMLKRLGADRKSYVERMRPFALCVQALVHPRGDINAALVPFTDAELYGGMWLPLIADVFRSDERRARFASEVVGLNEEEWADVLRVTTPVSTKYFGQDEERLRLADTTESHDAAQFTHCGVLPGRER